MNGKCLSKVGLSLREQPPPSSAVAVRTGTASEQGKRRQRQSSHCSHYVFHIQQLNGITVLRLQLLNVNLYNIYSSTHFYINIYVYLYVYVK